MASAGDVGAPHREKMLFSPSAPLKTLSVSSGGPTLFTINFFVRLRFQTNKPRRMDPAMTQAMTMAELGKGSFALSPLSSYFPALPSEFAESSLTDNSSNRTEVVASSAAGSVPGNSVVTSALPGSVEQNISSSVVTSAAWEVDGKSGGALVSTTVTGKISFSVPAMVGGAEVSPVVTAGDSGAVVAGGRGLVVSRTVVSGVGWRSEVV